MGSEYQGTSIGSGVQSQTSINAEWQLLETALGRLLNVYGDNTVGTNAMQVDFDMNSNDILNGGVGNFTSVVVNGVLIDPETATLPTLSAADVGRLIVVNDTFDGYDIATHFDLEHTATEDGSHAVEVIVDAAGFSDVKAYEIIYTSGAVAANDEEAIMEITIDQELAVGGHIYAMNVDTTDGGAHVHAVRAGAGVYPMEQASGTFANPTTGTNDTPSTDVGDMIDGSDATTTSIFVLDDDYILIGAAAVFTGMAVSLTTPASGAGIKPTFWYSITGTHQFTQFFPIDGTNGFRNSGVISWDDSGFVGHTTDAVTGTYDIKIIRTQNSLTTTPILGHIESAATTEYYWDNIGSVNVAELILNKGVLDEAFIDFNATIDGDATSAISTLTTSGSVTHHIQISLNGTTAWIPVSTTDPS